MQLRVLDVVIHDLNTQLFKLPKEKIQVGKKLPPSLYKDNYISPKKIKSPVKYVIA